MFIAVLPTDLHYSPDVVPPIRAVSYHVATDKPPPAQNGDKFRSIFSDNLQPIATRGKRARGTLLVDEHCGNGCSIKRAPLSFSNYNEISGGHTGRGLFGGVVLPAQYCSCGRASWAPHNPRTASIEYCMSLNLGPVFTALHVMQTRYIEENSARPSVRPSVTRVYCDKTEERSVQIFTSYERTCSLLFWEEEWLVGGDPFYLKFWVNRPPLERNRRFSTNNRS